MNNIKELAKQFGVVVMVPSRDIMITVTPKQAADILNGRATFIPRTWIPKDFVGWVNVYISKEKPYVYFGDLWEQYETDHYANPWGDELNGKVAFSFWYEDYEKLELHEGHYNFVNLALKGGGSSNLFGLGPNFGDLDKYGKGRPLYAWRINKLNIFKKPLELNDFYYYKKKLVYCGRDCPPYVDDVKFDINRAPRKMIWVFKKEGLV